MADWASLGHGMRRRSGLPSNHHEETGEDMGRQHYTADEVAEMAHNAGSARVPMGDEAFAGAGQQDELDADQFAGKLVPKQNTQAGDPTNPGSKQNRVNIERIGATYRITASTTHFMDPTLGPTQQGGRIVPSVAGRNTPNFESGNEASYL